MARGQHQEELDAVLASWTSRFSLDDVESVLARHEVPHGRIYRPRDMLDDPQFLARESITAVPHPQLGRVDMQNVAPRLSRTSGSVRWPGPALGADTADVLAGVGVSADDLRRLREAGVV